MKAQLAFLKRNRHIGDIIMKLIGRYKYSHIELIIDDKVYASDMPYGTSEYGRRYPISYYDLIDIEIDEVAFNDSINRYINKGYDYLSLLYIPMGINVKSNRFNCAKFISKILNEQYPLCKFIPELEVPDTIYDKCIRMQDCMSEEQQEG